MIAGPAAWTAAEVMPCTKRRHRIAGTEDTRPMRSDDRANATIPSLYSVALSLASASRPAGSSSATAAARNTVSMRLSAVAPAARSVPSAGSATATPETMNGGANCDAAIAGTRRGWAVARFIGIASCALEWRHVAQHSRRSADPSRRSREDRESRRRYRQGGAGRRGGERDRRRRHAPEPVPEESQKAARRRRARLQVSRVRQLPRRVAPAPRAQDVDRLADHSDGIREGCAHRRRERSRNAHRERRAAARAPVARATDVCGNIVYPPISSRAKGENDENTSCCA